MNFDLPIIVVAGTSSNVGKTTLLCDLLRELSRHEAWEAIKLTRGHYRSCGKDPHACCVSHLLGAQPLIRSGRAETYAAGKDTGRYWDAGAADVHWVIATDAQVEQGIAQALARVTAARVLIEGTSLLPFVPLAYSILTTRADDARPKASARRALSAGLIKALYISDQAAYPRETAITAASLQRLSPTPLSVFGPADRAQLLVACDSFARARLESVAA